MKEYMVSFPNRLQYTHGIHIDGAFLVMVQCTRRAARTDLNSELVTTKCAPKSVGVGDTLKD